MTTISVGQFLDKSNLIDIGFDISRGIVPNVGQIQKYGENTAVGTTAVTINNVSGGAYQTPTTGQSLELYCADANDDAAGTGARLVRVYGLLDDFVYDTEDVATNGGGVTALTKSFMRVYRARVIDTGTDTTDTNNSKSATGDIVVRDSGGAGDDWVKIGAHEGSTLCLAYTTAADEYAYMNKLRLSTDAGKSVEAHFHIRVNSGDAATYDPAWLVAKWPNVNDESKEFDAADYYAMPPKTDIWVMAKTASGTATVAGQFEGRLVSERF